MKYFELVPFEVRVTAGTVVRAIEEEKANGNEARALDTEESDK
jgi:hypothetical protein